MGVKYGERNHFLIIIVFIYLCNFIIIVKGRGFCKGREEWRKKRSRPLWQEILGREGGERGVRWMKRSLHCFL